MKLKKILLPAALSFLLLGAGCSLFQTVNVPGGAGSAGNTAANTNGAVNVNLTAATTVTYGGQDGKNALEILQAGYQIDASAEGFVNAINDIRPGDRQFWAFYVNGQQAQVGAKDYQTKSGDKIEWRLESY